MNSNLREAEFCRQGVLSLHNFYLWFKIKTRIPNETRRIKNANPMKLAIKLDLQQL
jgi:hypothetical protein